jgi:Ecdysteroid kinase-like family
LFFLLNPRQATFDIALLKTRFGKTHHERLRSDFYEKTFKVIEIMESAPAPFKVPKVLSHRDMWKNNLMFAHDEKLGFDKPLRCVLLDFQTARYLPITVDVLMTIVCTTRREHREQLYAFYTKFYYQKLTDELQKFNLDLSAEMSFENFAKSCDYHKTFALLYNVIVLMITKIPRKYFVDFSEDEFREFAEGNRSKFVLDYMEKDAHYRELLVEAVEAVIEHVYEF